MRTTLFRSEQHRRLLELPCVSRQDTIHSIIITHVSRKMLAEEMFGAVKDPVQLFEAIHREMLADIEASFREKFAVLEEIRNGTNRYRIFNGNFKDVGVDQ